MTTVGDDVEDTIAPPYATMLTEYVDVFQPFLSALPSHWEMTHTIPLEPDDKPSFRPIYKSSPLELQLIDQNIIKKLLGEGMDLGRFINSWVSHIICLEKHIAMNGGQLSCTQ